MGQVRLDQDPRVFEANELKGFTHAGGCVDTVERVGVGALLAGVDLE